MLKRIVDNFKSIWSTLDKTIYVGERYTSNMQALTFVSVVTVILSLILIVVNIVTDDLLFLIPSFATLIASVGCFYYSYVKKDREKAILFPIVFSVIFITIYIIKASGNGSFILWAILIPIGVCYFVSVKYGLLLSSYYP